MWSMTAGHENSTTFADYDGATPWHTHRANARQFPPMGPRVYKTNDDDDGDDDDDDDDDDHCVVRYPRLFFEGIRVNI